jgi:hypothetical protein
MVKNDYFLNQLALEIGVLPAALSRLLNGESEVYSGCG